MNEDDAGQALTEKQLEMLSSGFADSEIVEILRRGQRSKFLHHLSYIIDFAPKDSAGAAIELLERALLSDEQACLDTFAYQHVAVWAWVCLESLVGTSPFGSVDEHLRHLSCIAVVAAYRAHVGDFEISVPVSDGGVVLPSLGRARLDPSDPNDLAMVRCQDGRLQVSLGEQTIHVPEDPSVSGFDWDGIRKVHAICNDLEIVVAIDDLDPYRSYYSSSARVPPSDRLDDVGFKSWKEAIADAWSLLVTHHGEYATGISAGMQLVVPIARGDLNNHSHNRSIHAFGSIASSNVSRQWIAYALLEEFQRTKLAALDDLHPLHEDTHDEPKYICVWTNRPRSFSAMLESFYALPAVVELWDRQTLLASRYEERIRARMLSLRWRWRREGMRQTLLKSGELSDFGRDFIELIPQPGVLEDWDDVNADEVEAFARLIDRGNRLSWRLSNLRPTAEAIQEIIKAWTRGDECRTLDRFELEIYLSPVLRNWRNLNLLAIDKLANPSLFRELAEDHYFLQALYSSAKPADVLLIEGHVEAAGAAYWSCIAKNSNDLEAWAGFLTTRQECNGLVAEVFIRFPEVVVAVYGELLQLGEQVDPCVLAQWLAPMLSSKDETTFIDSTNNRESLDSIEIREPLDS